jgi:hypothetical protein
MVSVESKNMDRPDEARSPDKTMVSVVPLGPATVPRASTGTDYSYLWRRCRHWLQPLWPDRHNAVCYCLANSNHA